MNNSNYYFVIVNFLQNVFCIGERLFLSITITTAIFFTEGVYTMTKCPLKVSYCFQIYIYSPEVNNTSSSLEKTTTIITIVG